MKVFVLLGLLALLGCAAFDPPPMTNAEKTRLATLENDIAAERRALLKAETLEEASLHQTRLSVFEAEKHDLLTAYYARVDEWVAKMDAVFGGPPRRCTSTNIGGVVYTQCY